MTIPKIFSAGTIQRQKVLSTVLMGFSADPFVRWICPEAGNYINFIGAFNAYGGKAVDTNTAYVVEGFKGTALSSMLRTTSKNLWATCEGVVMPSRYAWWKSNTVSTPSRSMDFLT